MEGGDVVFLGGENLIGEVDWSNIFDDDLHGDANVLDWGEPAFIADSYASPSDAFSNNSPDSVSSWIDGIEKLLMEDDDESKVSPDSSSDYRETFLADLLVDSPADMSDEVPAPADSTDSDPNVSADANANSEEEEVDEKEKEKEKEKVEAAEVEDDADDPISKKRRRQLRNRDAAVRSRERKKMYVKDLEMKSKYLEGECRRLGRLLQCCYAENQALRVTMQMSGAFGASTTKQESAVLLLESLLLGSLLWLVVFMCLFTLPVNLVPILGAVLAEEHKARKAPERVARREAGGTSETFGYLVAQSSSVKNRRRSCKASWTKMKLSPDSHSLLQLCL